jgi:protein-tyrosine phosphatase
VLILAKPRPIHVLFVCLGNICRSPTAEGVFAALVARSGLTDAIVVDSCGTSDWHVGNAPDPRTIAAAGERGYDLRQLRGRQVQRSDFELYDYILAMDRSNLLQLQTQCPRHYKGHLGLFLSFAPEHAQIDVPDPYYGGADGFERVLDMIETASAGLLQRIVAERSKGDEDSAE